MERTHSGPFKCQQRSIFSRIERPISFLVIQFQIKALLLAIFRLFFATGPFDVKKCGSQQIRMRYCIQLSRVIKWYIESILSAQLSKDNEESEEEENGDNNGNKMKEQKKKESGKLFQITLHFQTCSNCLCIKNLFCTSLLKPN